MAGRLPQVPGLNAKSSVMFYKRSSSIVHSLNTRIRKMNLPGKLSLVDGRVLLAAAVENPCRYCKRRITVKTMSLDHPIPLARGGDPWELEAICDDCNRIKGGALEPGVFSDFCAHLKGYPEYAENYIRGMMKAGAAYQRLLAISRSKFSQARKVGQETPVESPALGEV